MARIQKPVNDSQYPSREHIWECATVCMEAQRVCLSSVRYSLNKGGRYSSAAFIRLLLDTAATCQTTAECCRSGSSFLTFSSSACAELSKLCALSCMRFEGDQQMQTTADICDRCGNILQRLHEQISEATKAA